MMNNVFLLFLVPSVVFKTVYSDVSLFPENLTLLQFTRNISNECLDQLNNLTSDPTMLLKMIDSSTKIPSGILNGKLWDLGDFDECYNLESTSNNGIIYGKYCLGSPFSANTDTKSLSTQLKMRPVHPVVREIGVGYHWAICIPNKCSAGEIATIPSFKEELCYSKDTAPELTTGAIITIVVLSIFLSISICSTIFDTYLDYMEKQAPHELLIAFSMLTNGRKLFNTTTNPDQLSCLNGIKSISMMWVVLGHILSLAAMVPLVNELDVLKYETDPWNMFMLDATLSVDSFFTVGGLVTVYVFLKSMDKGVKFNIILYYIHRYLRLTPAFGICILVHANLLRYLDNGPLWGKVEAVVSSSCIHDWWASFFYIYNYAHKQCMLQSWYLSVDMQLFLLSPLVLIPLHRFEKIGVYFLEFLCFLGVIVPFAIGYGYELNVNQVAADNNFNFYYYYQTHARFGPYVMGMLLGYLIFKTKKGQLNIALKPILACGLWLATMAGLIACVYAPYDALQTYNRVSHSLILAFQRQAWSLGVCIVIYLCVTGYGGPINKFLSLSVFQILARLSYSVYLVHAAVVILQYFRLKTLIHVSNYDMMFMFWGDFMLTLVLSIALYLVFESPIIVLEKYLFGRGKRTTKDIKPMA